MPLLSSTMTSQVFPQSLQKELLLDDLRIGAQGVGDLCYSLKEKNNKLPSPGSGEGARLYTFGFISWLHHRQALVLIQVFI